MDNNIIHIDKPNFDLAKTKIGQSLSKVPKSVQLEKFREKGTILSFTNHNVTGSEINQNLVAPLQKLLIDQNDNIKTIFRTLNDVYQAFESLDNEYIHGILSAVKSAELASNQAKSAGLKAEKASVQALDAVNKANKTQEDIKKTILALQKTVEILKEFKDKVTNDLSKLSSLSSQISSLKDKNQTIENRFVSIKQSVISVQSASAKLNGITHLDDIDTIWSDVESHKDDLSKVHTDHESFVSEVEEITARIYSDISALQAYRTQLESYSHLGDIDAIWSDVESHKDDLSKVHAEHEALVSQVEEITAHIYSDINALQAYRTQLESYSHLGDIDTIWDDVESHKEDLSKVHADHESLVSQVEEITARIYSDINALQAYRTQLESYSHLGDIDTIWDDVESHKEDLSKVHAEHEALVSQVEEITARIYSDISALQAYRSQLESYSHLGDIDTIWSDVEDHKLHLSTLDKLLEDFIEEINKKTDVIKNEISEMANAQQEKNEQFDKRIKKAYRIAGWSIALSLGHMLLQWLGVL